MKKSLKKIEKKLYKLISKQANFEDEKCNKNENTGEKYWISVGKTIAFSKSISLIEKELEKN